MIHFYFTQVNAKEKLSDAHSDLLQERKAKHLALEELEKEIEANKKWRTEFEFIKTKFQISDEVFPVK